MIINPYAFAQGASKDLSVVTWTGDGTGGRQISGPDMSAGGVVLLFGVTGRGIVFSEDGSSVIYKVAGTSPGPVVISGISFNSSGISITPTGGEPSWNSTGELYLAVIASKDPDICNVVQYTGNAANRSIAHGLSSVPQFIVPVNFTTSGANLVQQALSSPASFIYWVANSVPVAGADLWNSTAADSTNVYIGSGTGVNRVNTNGDTYYLIVFADSVCNQLTYTGNGSATGPLVNGFGYTPELIYVRNISESATPRIVSSAINPGYTGNETQFIFGGSNTSENLIQAIAGGFQPVTTNSGWNQNARTILAYGFRPKP